MVTQTDIKRGPSEKPAEKPGSFLKGLFDRLIGHAKKAKATVEARSGIKPILALESRIPIPKLKGLIHQICDRVVPQILPLLQGKNVLEIGEGPLYFQQTINQMKPKLFCGIVVDTNLQKRGTTESPYLARGSFRGIPFDQNFFDCVLGNLTTPHQGDVVSAVKEISRVLLPDGYALLIDFHPFGSYAKQGTERLRSHQATIRGVEDYFRMCKVAGLSVLDFHEGFLDDTLRNQFQSQEDIGTFRELKGMPLVVFFLVTKVRKIPT